MKCIDQEFFDDLLNFTRTDGTYLGVQSALGKLNIPSGKISDGRVFLTLEEAEAIAARFALYGLPRSADILLEWVRRVGGSRNLPPEVVMSELHRSIRRELRANLFFHIDENRRNYFEDRHQFGESVSTAFPSAVVDIEEAGKCYALSRNTACVFHLMRVMEVALRVFAKTLDDPRLDPKRNPSWNSILKKCYDELEKDRQSRSPEWAADDAFFSDVSARLMAVKDAWRNPTMHVEIVYDDEKALDVFNHVRSFMRHLAVKLKE